jgi:hypothetical protein
VREAVNCVLNDPMPDELTRHALDALRHQTSQYPRKARRRIASWTVPAIAASIVVIALAAYFRATQTDDGRSGTAPVLPTTRQDAPAASANDLPTAWAYTLAARQSPDALDALLDRHTRQSISANARFSPKQASLRSIRQAL